MEMSDVRNHKSRALPYGALLTKVFENFQISFRNKHDQHINGGFTENIISRGISIGSTNNEGNEEKEMELKVSNLMWMWMWMWMWMIH